MVDDASASIFKDPILPLAINEGSELHDAWSHYLGRLKLATAIAAALLQYFSSHAGVEPRAVNVARDSDKQERTMRYTVVER